MKFRPPVGTVVVNYPFSSSSMQLAKQVSNKLAQTDYVLQQEAFEKQYTCTRNGISVSNSCQCGQQIKLSALKGKMQPSNPGLYMVSTGKIGSAIYPGREFIFHWEKYQGRKRFDRPAEYLFPETDESLIVYP